MGVVYRAEQERPRREVALKLIRAGFASGHALRRFEFEAELLGRLKHPGIAQIHEAGIDEATGSPYFAMELVDGATLTDYAMRRKLGTRDRLRLFTEICFAVQQAHVQGVIHRDLKPTNIIVTEVGDPPRPQPKILDFGVARLTDSDTQTMTLRTDIGQLIGTVPYMSPEQVTGDPAALDTRSDVYALGVVLYELLVGRLPYDLANCMVYEAARVIREEDPTRLRRLSPSMRGDVETIVAKALEKDKERRYQTASDLAWDINRFLDDEPIMARLASSIYQLRKFTRRNRALAGGVVATFVVLVAGLVSTVVFAVRAEDRRVKAVAAQSAEREARRQADENALMLEQVATFQASQLSGIDVRSMGAGLRENLVAQFRSVLERMEVEPAEIERRLAELEPLFESTDFTGMALTSLDVNIFQRAGTAIDRQFPDQPLLRARLVQTLATTMRGLGLLDQALPLQVEALALRRAELGDEHEDTIYSTSQMVDQFILQGKTDEAERLQRETLALSRGALGDDHRLTLISLRNLAWLLQGQGRVDEAEPLMREALAGYRRAYGSDDPQSLNAMSNMGTLLFMKGRLEDAEPYFRERLERSLRLFGEDHPGTIGAHAGLGFLLMHAGSTDEAERHLTRAFEWDRRTHGDDHHDTMGDLTNLGVLYREQGRLGKAESVFRDAVERKRRVLGDEHPETLNDISNLGDLLRRQGRLDEAEPLERLALDARRRILGEDNPQALESMQRMGELLLATDRIPDAESVLRDCYERRARVLGEGHWQTRVAQSLLGEALVRQLRYAEAEALLIDAFTGMDPKPFSSGPKRAALRRIIDLYGSWQETEPDAGHDVSAADWRATLDAMSGSSGGVIDPSP